MSLRRRVLAYVALAAIASCALTTAVAVVLVRHKIASQRATALETQANVLSLVGGAPGALTVGDHVYRVGTGKPKRVRPVLAQAVLSAIGAPGDSEGTVTIAGRGAALRRPLHGARPGGAHARRPAGLRRMAAVPGRA